MKQRNKYDIAVEELASRFRNIPNFNLTQEDEVGRKLFLFIIKRLSELNSLKTLFLQIYIPKTNEFIASENREISKSQYKKLLSLSKIELNENYYEIIRLGYVGMFHKYESFIQELISQAEDFVNNSIDPPTSLLVFCKEKFNYDPRDCKKSQFIEKINWICNCIKHKDGFPIKSPKPLVFENLNENERLKFTKDNFKSDLEILLTHYNIMLQMILSIGIYMIFLSRDYEDLSFINASQEIKGTIEKMILELQ